jgi:hypothetical protein
MTIKALYPNIIPSLSLDFANVENLDPRITFARASTATYYNGVTTAKAEENLLIESQELELWSNISATTATANTTTAPDGTSTADTLTETTATTLHYAENRVAPTVSGSTYAISVFLKKGTGATAPDVVQVTWAGAGFATNVYANFNLTLGTVTASGAGVISSAITDAGSGWYRCSFTANASSSVTNSGTSVVFCNNDGSATRAPSYLGLLTSDVFVWGAQLEQRSAVTAYTPTTTQPITNYVPVLLSAADNVARFDHNPVTGESLGLLIEEQRTNLYTYSGDLADTGGWNDNLGITVTANQAVAPDGTLAATLVQQNTSSTSHRVRRNPSTTYVLGERYTQSAYLKFAGRRYVGFWMFNTRFGVNQISVFDLVEGTVFSTSGGATATITPVGNGWFRCTNTSIACTSGGNSGSDIAALYSDDGSTNIYTAPNEWDGVLVWGAQIEEGAFPTSYIPTVAAQVTRSADAASMTGANFSSWYSENNIGSFYAESNEIGGNNSGPFWLNDGANTRGIAYRRSTDGGALEASYRSASANRATAIAGSIVPIGQSNKVAVSFDAANTSVSANGAVAVSSSSSNIYPSINQVRVGFVQVAGSSPFIWCGHIRKLAYYPKRLADAELQALTQN